MGAFNFQKRFAPAIKAGTKRSTIRRRSKTGYLPKVKERLSLYTGMRTAKCKRIKRVVVVKVTPIIINTNTDGALDAAIFDGRQLRFIEVLGLAMGDGFETVEEFAEFFHRMYGTEFTGYLIEW